MPSDMGTDSSTQPMYVKIREQIKQDILDGTYQKGEQIPTEQELSKAYQASRITIRTALDELQRENYIIRKRGKGTFVAEEKLEREIAGVLSFSSVCESMGRKPGSKVIKCIYEQANSRDQIELGLTSAEAVLVLERVRYADDVPVSLEIGRFPSPFFFLFEEDLFNKSLYDLLRDKYGIVFGNSRKEIEIVYASYPEAKYLDVTAAYPLLSITSVVCDVTKAYAYRSRQLIVSDKFKLII